MGTLNIPRHIPTPAEAFEDMMGITNTTNSSSIKDISIDRLVHYSNHPFEIKEERVNELVESIREQGIILPLIVRPLNDKYEVLAGHHRLEAAKLADLQIVPCVVKDVDDDTAALIVVESNNQRGFAEMLPSEIAKALQLEYNALKHQGKKSELFEHLEKNRQALHEHWEMSERSMRYYIRLNYLISPLLMLVDDKKIAVRAAVHLSFITPDNQEIIFNCISVNTQLKINIDNAIQLKEFCYEKDLTAEDVSDILNTKKATSCSTIKFSFNELEEYLPYNLEISEQKDYIINALEFYNNSLS